MKLLPLLLKTKIRLAPPRFADIVIWDRVMVDEIRLLLGCDAPVLLVRGEELYIVHLLRAIILRRYAGMTLTERYSLSVLVSCSPKLVITGNDNSLIFMKLGHQLRRHGIRTAAFQSTRRFEKRDIFGEKPQVESHVSTLFCFSHHIAKKYSDYLDASSKLVVTGSLKANLFAEDSVPPPSQRSIAYISGWHPNFGFPNKRLYGAERDGPITWGEYSRMEAHVIRALAHVAETKGEKVFVLARRKDDYREEEYFRQILGRSFGGISVRSHWWSNYEAAQKMRLVVCMDSSLGYELLGLGIRVFFAGLRLVDRDVPALRFGWPANVPDSGPFWLSKWYGQADLESRLDELYEMPESNLTLNQSRFTKLVIESDEGLTKTRLEISKLLEE